MSHIFQKSDHHVALLCREAGRSMKSPSLFPSDGFDRSFIRCIRNCNRERPSVVRVWGAKNVVACFEAIQQFSN